MSSFEFDGEKYKAGSLHQKEWGNKIIGELAEGLAGNERILDLGCGDGVLTRQLAELVPDGYVLGIDASRGMIATAEAIVIKNLGFRRQDIDTIGFVDQFDLIFSNATLHWILDHRLLLRNCHIALKEGGRVRFNFAGDGNCSTLNSAVKKRMATEEFRDAFRDFPWPWYMPKIGDYRRLCEESRFRSIEVWEENADRHFESETEMIRWIDQPSLVPFLTAIPEDSHKRRFRDLVVEDMVVLTREGDGRCFETFRRINVSARKQVNL